MPFSIKLPLIILLLLFLLPLIGCGEKTGVQSSSSKTEQSHKCIGCHQGVINSVTGKAIVDEWHQSRHNTSNVAGCADCHDPEPGHPTGCNLCHGGTPAVSLTLVSKNPDEDKKCSKCHDAENGIFPTGARRAHFAHTNYPDTFKRYTASYVSTNYIGKCRKCHNPHDPTSDIGYNRTWAKSGLGLVTKPSRVSRDFKQSGTDQPANLAYDTQICVRCHTTTGYLHFIESGFSVQSPFGSSTDKTKEVTACDVCHPNYNFKTRSVSPVTIYYNFSAAVSLPSVTLNGHKIQNYFVPLPNLGDSNVCVPCHAGRGVGSQIKTLDANGVNFSSINNSPSSHYYSSAGILAGNNGYEFPSKNYTTGIGASTGHNTTGQDTGIGPCISCHMSKTIKSDTHTFKPVIHGDVFSLYSSNRSWTQVYSVASSSPASLTISSLTSLSCNTNGCHASLTAAELTNDKEGYISALAVLNKWVRLVRNVPQNPQTSLGAYNPSTKKYPNPARLTADWTYLGGGSGPDLMGATFNLSTLNNEPGAYVHNPLYAKRLLYDSLYFLSTKATDPALGSNQYPTVQQFNVADAIMYLTVTTARTLESGGPANDPTKEVVATITRHQADAAIKWIYGKTYLSLTPFEKDMRPGGN